MMKYVGIAAWICFGIDALAVIWLFLLRDMGNDAAGRGVGTGFAIVLAPLVAAAGAGLWWAQRQQSSAGVVAAAVVLGLPFLFAAANYAQSLLRDGERALYTAGFGRFSDPRLNEVVAAIRARDTAKVKALAGSAALDWNARDARGQTILGFAVAAAIGRDGSPRGGDPELDMVEALVAAGAPYRHDAMEENLRLFPSLLSTSVDHDLRLIGLLLRAGADPNDQEQWDHRPMLLHHNMTVAKARLLLQHGADLKGLRDTRADRPAWDALMNAAYMQNWELALFYLEQGCDPRHRAQDGKTVRDVIAELKRDGQFRDRDAAAFPAFEAALAKRP